MATLNGSMDMEASHTDFADFRGEARVLISTDAGGEGLNLPPVMSLSISTCRGTRDAHRAAHRTRGSHRPEACRSRIELRLGRYSGAPRFGRSSRQNPPSSPKSSAWTKWRTPWIRPEVEPVFDELFVQSLAPGSHRGRMRQRGFAVARHAERNDPKQRSAGRAPRSGRRTGAPRRDHPAQFWPNAPS